MATALINFDVIDFLQNEADVAGYLNDMLTETGDGDVAALTRHVLGNAVRWGTRAYGAETFCAATGRDRCQIQQALHPGGRPSFEVVLAIANALGLRLQFVTTAEAS
jgi:probable addiction module antidote protein